MKRQWIIDLVGQEAFEKLAGGLEPSQLQSVLLEVLQARAHARSPADVLAQWQRDAFVQPAAVDLRESVEIDRDLLAAAAAFEAVELSPVAPLGVCSSIAPTDQNRVLSAARSTEVSSDPTNVLALLCASRLPGVSHLATSHRVVRAQPVPKGEPGYAPHFRLFALASGGIETKDHGFTVEALTLHIRTMVAALDRLEQRGYAFGDRKLEVLATPERASVADRVAAAVGGARGPLEHPYYAGLRYQLSVGGVPLVDGGSFDWLQKLKANRRAVYVASGLGAQLVALRFKRGA
ncbi:MAG: hypothetical protein JNK82_23405 [Myxococcaceae bacterium]|nr:hypothetical protein [Myxococcaceae bacterium]